MFNLPKFLLSGEIRNKYLAPFFQGCITLNGPDALPFLERLSTAHLLDLELKQSRATCLLNKFGKLIDRLLVIRTAEESFLLISSFSDIGPTLAWLESYHFVEELSLKAETEQSFTLCWPYQESSDFCWWPNPNTSLQIGLQANKEGSQIVLSEEEWQSLRIACGLPAASFEINDKYMPQNIGLAQNISQNKGCYLGQEVVAKAITYQKRPKVLVELKMPEELWQKAKIGEISADNEGNEAQILSLAPIYWQGLTNALGLREEKIK